MEYYAEQSLLIKIIIFVITTAKAKKTRAAGVLAGAAGMAIVGAIPCFMGGGGRNTMLQSLR